VALPSLGESHHPVGKLVCAELIEVGEKFRLAAASARSLQVVIAFLPCNFSISLRLRIFLSLPLSSFTSQTLTTTPN